MTLTNGGTSEVVDPASDKDKGLETLMTTQNGRLVIRCASRAKPFEIESISGRAFDVSDLGDVVHEL
jgi:hypothetical protein